MVTGSDWTARQKREAFDWLQDFANAPGAPLEARVALDELAQVAAAAYPQAPTPRPGPALRLVRGHTDD